MTQAAGREITGTQPPRTAALSATVLVVSANAELRAHLAKTLRGLRWTVQEAESGAEAWLRQEDRPCGAVLLDEWLPDLSAREFAQQFLEQFPTVDMLTTEGSPVASAVRSPRRNELLLALRDAEHLCAAAPAATASGLGMPPVSAAAAPVGNAAEERSAGGTTPVFALPGMLGGSAAMQELGALIRLAAPHSASILVEGETGTGKELVAQAVHRLSGRSAKPFVTLNCAAIPEQLLESELFGHTRGAFTGAVNSRMGRIEAAHGGTLFLDEIGEMPLPLQAKMLRFLECGEIQRIGENETSRVDVRIVAATHQPLELNAEQGRFRLDLFHRLSVFPVWVPPLRERMEDVPMLVQFALERLGQDAPQRSISAAAMDVLLAHSWPGNVRELLHVLQRAVILSTHSTEIGPEHIRLRARAR
ncbi:sigma-54-dependent transcriptional regulator [Terriglobus aquaticus]|uniref:Sigma-54-dependent transcriptional regulator n=1 Tax=Terriglobus aquaticus TaxID=940139 RepID=A0ABW9KLS0_9BACT|nr:sigma-54 dependent transcriptional regulator [Terriglobus aquaticus]